MKVGTTPYNLAIRIFSLQNLDRLPAYYLRVVPVYRQDRTVSNLRYLRTAPRTTCSRSVCNAGSRSVQGEFQVGQAPRLLLADEYAQLGLVR